MATGARRGFYASFQYVTLIGGQLTALLVLLVLQNFLLSDEQLRAWGWRVGFLIGAALALIALIMRRDLFETEIFQRHAQQRAHSGHHRDLQQHKEQSREVLAGHYPADPIETLTQIGLSYFCVFLILQLGFRWQVVAAVALIAAALGTWLLIDNAVSRLAMAVTRLTAGGEAGPAASLTERPGSATGGALGEPVGTIISGGGRA
jgi:MFS family permease